MESVSQYKYIIDTSAILSQKGDEQYRRSVFRTLWKTIDEMITNKELVICSEIAAEIQDDDIKTWLKEKDICVLPIDDEIQANVREVVTSVNKDLVDFKENKSSGDVFLIATAMKYGLAVITEEKKNSPKKIPYTCQQLNIDCMNMLEFMEKKGISL